MMLRKQTVWLLTMLAVMVVLSGYYMVKGPEEQIPAAISEQHGEGQPTVEQPINGVQVDTKQLDQPVPEVAVVEGKETVSQPPATKAPSAPAETTDKTVPKDTQLDGLTATNQVFTGYKLKRESTFQQQKDDQTSIMTNSSSTPQAIAEADARIQELSTMEQQTVALEELIKTKGYKDCVVMLQAEGVMIMVQKDKLESKEAAEIIGMAKVYLKVPGQKVTVSYQP
ncbi:SpoIIIAH-like family protein [Brevibacillus daliensis]|uniref:SpoIIIAH-like family protein n=1 Tax=Brevibacillus daliensis TaxID=2892995 RepID=UPI001E2ED9C6|nr:SpoIIIAH-like family protein [Brevibacillus daliensis]